MTLKYNGNFENFFICMGWGGEGEGFTLFIPRTVSKQYTTSPLQSLRYFVPIKNRVANPHPLKNFLKISFKNVFGFFFWGGGMGSELIGGRGNFIHSKTSLIHEIQLLTCKVRAILYLSKERVANPHPRM